MNERTNTLLYKNIPLTLYSRKVWYWLCERGELETGTDCYILTRSSSRDHSSTSFSFWLGCSTVGHWGSTSCSHAGILSPTATGTELTDSSRLWAYSTTSTGQSDIPISSTECTCFAVLPLIYTGASLDWRLGRGSVCYTGWPPHKKTEP